MTLLTPVTWVWSLEPTWERERINSHKFSSDLHTCAVAHPYHNPQHPPLRHAHYLFQVTVSDISVSGWLTQWIWAWGETEYHGNRDMVEDSHSPRGGQET